MTGLFPRAARSPVCDGEMPSFTAHRRRGVAHRRLGRSSVGARADVARVLPARGGAAWPLDRRGPVAAVSLPGEPAGSTRLPPSAWDESDPDGRRTVHRIGIRVRLSAEVRFNRLGIDQIRFRLGDARRAHQVVVVDESGVGVAINGAAQRQLARDER